MMELSDVNSNNNVPIDIQFYQRDVQRHVHYASYNSHLMIYCPMSIARIVFAAIFVMLTTDEVFNPCDLHKIDMPKTMEIKQKEKALKQDIRFIQSHGLSVG